MILLEEAGVALEGAEAVVIGRSNLFGKPMAQLLLQANATVTTCHSRTRDLAGVARRADVLIAADRPRRDGRRRLGQAGRGGHRRRASTAPTTASSATSTSTRRSRSPAAITPVPGGVGPMTIACLLRNTLQAARLQVAGP